MEIKAVGDKPKPKHVEGDKDGDSGNPGFEKQGGE